MLIHDDTFTWEGFGGVYQLASGQCRLRIFDLSRQPGGNITYLRPVVVVVSDLPPETSDFQSMSVRSCAGHIATLVAEQFNIAPQRMTYVEYYPSSTYGNQNQHTIPARLDVVEFSWFENKALHPKWRPLGSPLDEAVASLIVDTEQPTIA